MNIDILLVLVYIAGAAVVILPVLTGVLLYCVTSN